MLTNYSSFLIDLSERDIDIQQRISEVFFEQWFQIIERPIIHGVAHDLQKEIQDTPGGNDAYLFTSFHFEITNYLADNEASLGIRQHIPIAFHLNHKTFTR